MLLLVETILGEQRGEVWQFSKIPKKSDTQMLGDSLTRAREYFFVASKLTFSIF